METTILIKEMKKYFPAILIFLLSNVLHPALAQGVKINEIMSSNANTIHDENDDSSDWIELFNAGQSEVDLSGFGLSDNETKPFKWIFPAIKLQPGAFLLIWASGKDRAVEGEPLHTGFKIKGEGERVLLTNPEGERVDEIAPISIPTDYSYGRQSDGTDQFYFFSSPTPAASNDKKGYSGLLSPPEFSHTAGFYPSSFDLTISSPDPEVSIIYTVDGSIPEVENLAGNTYTYKNKYPKDPGDPFGELLTGYFESVNYTQPLHIRDRSSEEDVLTQKSSTWHRNPWYSPDEPVYKGTVVKARAIKEGALPSKVVTHTYFISDKIHHRYSLAVVSLSVQEDALFDYEKGIYVAGKDFDDWRRSNPNVRVNGSRPGNYHRGGREWEYPAHMEIFEGEKGRVLSQDIGIRIHGGWSRSFPVKSIRLYARNEYGSSHFNYAFFPEQQDSTYKRLVLRNSGNDWRFTLFRDAAMQSMVQHLDLETQAYRPAVLFINSEYWGIHNFRERYDKHYFERVYGADPEKLDILEKNMEVDEGNASHFQETIDYIKNNSLSEEKHYEYVKSRIDIENFINYQLAQIFFANSDWPGNNIKYWRYQTDHYQEGSPKELDGRWRWLLYDTDFGFGLDQRPINRDMMRLATNPDGHRHPNPPWSTFLFRSLLKNKSFERDFINRFADQLNTAFLPEVTRAKINLLKEEIQAEMAEHIERWSRPDNMSEWGRFINKMLAFSNKRPAFQRQHLRDFFNLGADYQLEVDVSNTEGGHVNVNSLELRAGTEGLAEKVYPWSGTYFKGVPIALEAIPAPGFVFAGWQGSSSSSSGKITLDPNSDVSLRAVFKSITSGIKDVAQKYFQIKVYPNPFKAETELKIELQARKQLTIILQDLSGKVQAEIARESLMPGEHHFKIRAAHLAPGFYILNCQLDNQRIYFKVLKN